MLTMLLAAALAVPAQTVEPAAMVLAVKGQPTCERAKSPPQRLRVMDFVRPGDRVLVPDNGEIILLFLQDGHRERLAPQAQATVNGTGCHPAAQRLEGPKLAEANLQSLRGLSKNHRSGGIYVRSGDSPPQAQGVTPLYGATVLSDRPALAWPDAKAEAYRVQLFSGAATKGQRPLWQTTVKAPRLAYPEKEKPLTLGRKYRWRVVPLKGEDASADPIVDSTFLTLTKSEKTTLLANLKPLLASKSPADLLLAAVCYEAHGVSDEALYLYERLAELSPDEANLQITLANYYDSDGRKELAQKARDRAKQLGVVSPK